MEKQKNRKILTISIIVSILLLGVIASTYAYFQAVISNGSSSATSVSAKTIDGLTFVAGNDISISANQDNFASGKGDITVYSNPGVTLQARNDEASSYNYTMCINITENTFVHSQVGSTDQGLGKTDNLFNINALKEALGYAPTSITDNTYILPSGKTSVIQFSKLCPDCEAGKTTIDLYQVSVTLKNYSTSQNINEGKTLTANVVFKRI